VHLSKNDGDLEIAYNDCMNLFKILDTKNDDRVIKDTLPYAVYLEIKEYLVQKNYGQSAQTIADYFSLREVQKDRALAQAKDYIKKENLQFSLDEVEKRIDDNFSKGYLKNLSDRFKKRTWRNNRQFNKEIMQNPVINTGKQTGKLATKYGEKEYTFYPSEGDLKTIILSAYGGYSKYSCNRGNISKPFAEGIMTTTLDLGDCGSDVPQWEQLTPKNFATTHVRYIRVISEYISFLKTTYPQAKIILQGDSFGGFFTLAYAYVQFAQENTSMMNTYKEWVKTAYKEELNNHKLPQIDGIIIHDGAIDHMALILQETKALKELTTPILIHQNFDDERVTGEEIKEVLKCLDISFLRLVLSRYGARAHLSEQQKETTDHGNGRSKRSILELSTY
jgi:hypothetical protein